MCRSVQAGQTDRRRLPRAHGGPADGAGQPGDTASARPCRSSSAPRQRPARQRSRSAARPASSPPAPTAAAGPHRPRRPTAAQSQPRLSARSQVFVASSTGAGSASSRPSAIFGAGGRRPARSSPRRAAREMPPRWSVRPPTIAGSLRRNRDDGVCGAREDTTRSLTEGTCGRSAIPTTHPCQQTMRGGGRGGTDRQHQRKRSV